MIFYRALYLKVIRRFIVVSRLNFNLLLLDSNMISLLRARLSSF